MGLKVRRNSSRIFEIRFARIGVVTGNSRRAHCRLRSEPLEVRALLAVVNWTGLGDGTNWTNPANWSNDAVPGAGDDVTINVAGHPTITIASNSQAVVHSLLTTSPININAFSNLGILGNAEFDNTLTLGASGLTSDASMSVGGNLVLNGTIALNGASVLDFTGLSSTSQAISGSGVIETGDNTGSEIVLGNSSTAINLTIGSGITLAANSFAYQATTTILNQGTIESRLAGRTVAVSRLIGNVGNLQVARRSLSIAGSNLTNNDGLSVAANESLTVNGLVGNLGSIATTGTGANLTIDNTLYTGANLVNNQGINVAGGTISIDGLTGGLGNVTYGSAGNVSLDRTRVRSTA